MFFMPDTVDHFGTPERPNLELISSLLTPPLAIYQGIIRHHLPEFRLFPRNDGIKLSLTPEKTTTARCVLPVTLGETKLGDVYIILFAPGDGTGKEGDYQLDHLSVKSGTYCTAKEVSSDSEIQIPEGYQFEPSNKPGRVLPRNKLEEGVLIEAFLPLFSVNGEEKFPYAVSLEQITVDNINTPTGLVRGLEMGVSQKAFECATNPRLYDQPDWEPQIQLTCGYRRNGQRFGDPHATFYNPALAKDRLNLMQVAGFLSVESADNPLCKVLDRIATAPQ